MPKRKCFGKFLKPFIELATRQTMLASQQAEQMCGFKGGREASCPYALLSPASLESRNDSLVLKGYVLLKCTDLWKEREEE